MSAGQGISRFAEQVSDYFVPEQVGEDAEELRRRGNMVLVVIAVCIADLLWSAVYQGLFGSPRLSTIAALMIPFAASMAFLMKSGFPIPRLTGFSLLLYFGTAVGITIATGGVWPGGIYFVALVPAVAVVLAGPNAAIPSTLATLCTFAFLSAFTGRPDFEPFITFSEADIRSGNFRVAVILSLVVASISGFLSRIYQRAYESWRDEALTVKQAEARFRAISENAHDLIAELDGDGTIIYASPGYEEVTGRAPDRIVGNRLFDVVDPDDLAMARMYWDELMEKGVVKQEPLRFETGDRGTRWLEVTMKSYLSRQGEERIVAVARDVTHRLEQEKRMRRQESLASMGTMAAGAAHQLSSPLTAMVASTQFARLVKNDDRDLDPAVLEMLDRIEREATRCGQILRSMLSFASEEPSERWVERIHPVIERAVRAVREHADASSVEIVISRSPDNPRVLMSPIEVEQVFINLILNSVQADATVVVLGTVIDEDGYLHVTVSDDGKGISENDRDKIFQPFYTSHPGTGSGLGLAIAREIISDHGGQVQVLGTGEEGTVVRVELPLPNEEIPALLQ